MTAYWRTIPQQTHCGFRSLLTRPLTVSLTFLICSLCSAEEYVRLLVVFNAGDDAEVFKEIMK